VSDIAGEVACREGIYDLTRNLVEAARSSCSHLKRFVYVSTALTLGYDTCNISPDNPGKTVRFLPYVRYKMETETLLSDKYKMNGFPVVILRPGDVYGPNDRTSCLQMLEAIERGMPMIVGHGRWRFAYCYIDNFCQAAYLACECNGIDGRSFTVTNSRFPTWREWFSGLQRVMGKKQRLYLPVGFIHLVTLILSGIHKIFHNFSPPLTHYRFKRITSHTTYNISETIQSLGYRPDDDLKAQIQATVSWYRREKHRRSQEENR
jgi:nucleoside-diphosphate-sugar epimerase